MDPVAALADRLERCFAEVAATRMEGVPILNPALSVRAVGMRAWQPAEEGAVEDHAVEHRAAWGLCTLVTPWFMNLMLLPPDGAGEVGPVGVKRVFAFPAGRFEFIRGFEAALGSYWMCSLFSPVFEFADQETAETTAALALDALFEAEEETGAQEREMAMIWRGDKPAPVVEADEDGGTDAEAGADPESASASVSRRAFLRGARRSESGREANEGAGEDE